MDRLKIGRKHVSNHDNFFFLIFKKGQLFFLKSLTLGASKVTLPDSGL